MITLTGKRALVTGGSRGIGREVVLMLARAGADVGFSYYARHRDAEEVLDLARAEGVRAFAVAGDVADRAFADRLFDRAREELGGIDFFVGNAGVWPPAYVDIGDMSDDQWRRTMAVNVDAVFYQTRLAARRMNDGGRIVLVSSTAGQRGEAGHADYAASKGAIISFVKSIAVELAPRQITVNSVAPGWVDTEMVGDAITPDTRGRIEAAIPIGRIATARDIAGPIVFLCSDLARHITGEILNVNGGAVLCG